VEDQQNSVNDTPRILTPNQDQNQKKFCPYVSSFLAMQQSIPASTSPAGVQTPAQVATVPVPFAAHCLEDKCKLFISEVRECRIVVISDYMMEFISANMTEPQEQEEEVEQEEEQIEQPEEQKSE